MSSIQGNLDVALLEKGQSKERLTQAVEKMLQDFGPQGLIANLGEGLTGKEDPELVAHFIDSVHSISERMIQQ